MQNTGSLSAAPPSGLAGSSATQPWANASAANNVSTMPPASFPTQGNAGAPTPSPTPQQNGNRVMYAANGNPQGVSASAYETWVPVRTGLPQELTDYGQSSMVAPLRQSAPANPSRTQLAPPTSMQQQDTLPPQNMTLGNIGSGNPVRAPTEMSQSDALAGFKTGFDPLAARNELYAQYQEQQQRQQLQQKQILTQQQQQSLSGLPTNTSTLSGLTVEQQQQKLPDWLKFDSDLQRKTYSTGRATFLSNGSQISVQADPVGLVDPSVPYLTPKVFQVLDDTPFTVMNRINGQQNMIPNINLKKLIESQRQFYRAEQSTDPNGGVTYKYSGPTNRNVSFLAERGMYPKNYRSEIDKYSFGRSAGPMYRAAQSSTFVGAIRT